MDSAVFSSKKYNDLVWAPAGYPLTQKDAWFQGKYVSCHAAISAEQGLVHQVYKHGKAFEGADIE
jgi:hypothetical protein